MHRIWCREFGGFDKYIRRENVDEQSEFEGQQRLPYQRSNENIPKFTVWNGCQCKFSEVSSKKILGNQQLRRNLSPQSLYLIIKFYSQICR